MGGVLLLQAQYSTFPLFVKGLRGKTAEFFAKHKKKGERLLRAALRAYTMYGYAAIKPRLNQAYWAALAASMALTSSGTTLYRSPTMP